IKLGNLTTVTVSENRNIADFGNDPENRLWVWIADRFLLANRRIDNGLLFDQVTGEKLELPSGMPSLAISRDGKTIAWHLLHPNLGKLTLRKSWWERFMDWLGIHD